MADQSGAEQRAGTTHASTTASSSTSGSGSSRKASKSKANVDRVERPEGAPDGAPRAVSRWKGAEAGPDVSNAELDLGTLSPVAEHSTYHENPDPNPDEVRPAPGPSIVQVLGQVGSIPEQDDDDEPLANKGEETR